MGAVVEQAVFSGGFFFLAVDAESRKKIGANHLQVSNGMHKVSGYCVIAGKAAFVVHHDGHMVCFRTGLDLQCFCNAEGNGFFQNDEARFCPNCLETFGKVGVFVYGDGDDVRVEGCIQFVTGRKGLRFGKLFFPAGEIFGIRVCGGDKAYALVLAKGHGVGRRLLPLFVKSQGKADASGSDEGCSVLFHT